MVWDDSPGWDADCNRGEVYDHNIHEVTVSNGGEPAGKVDERPGGIIQMLHLEINT